LGRTQAEIVCAGPFDTLKHRFLDLEYVVFWEGQNVEKEFAGPVEFEKT
jgi:hypothetical protein